MLLNLLGVDVDGEHQLRVTLGPLIAEVRPLAGHGVCWFLCLRGRTGPGPTLQSAYGVDGDDPQLAAGQLNAAAHQYLEECERLREWHLDTHRCMTPAELEAQRRSWTALMDEVDLELDGLEQA